MDVEQKEFLPKRSKRNIKTMPLVSSPFATNFGSVEDNVEKEKRMVMEITPSSICFITPLTMVRPLLGSSNPKYINHPFINELHKEPFEILVKDFKEWTQKDLNKRKGLVKSSFKLIIFSLLSSL